MGYRLAVIKRTNHLKICIEMENISEDLLFVGKDQENLKADGELHSQTIRNQFNDGQRMPQRVKYKPELKNIAIRERVNETESIVYEENNPSNIATMIQGGNIELTKAIEMVHKYNLMINEGKNLHKKDRLVHEETKLVHEGNELRNKNSIVHE